MLPLWTEPDRLVLGEQSLALHRRGKKHSVSLPWESPHHIDFNTLAASLPVQMQNLAGRKINIVLSNCWVRYLIIPWQEHVYARKDWLALAQNRMREQFGVKATDWDVQIHMQGYRQPVLVVASDRQLVEGLDALADQLRWHVQRIEPAFAAVVNRYPRHWRGDSWLLMAEHKRLLLVESKAGIWQRITPTVSSAEMMNQHAKMLLQQARQFNPETRKRRLYLCRTGVLPEQDLIEGMETRLLPADWLSNESEATA